MTRGRVAKEDIEGLVGSYGLNKQNIYAVLWGVADMGYLAIKEESNQLVTSRLAEDLAALMKSEDSFLPSPTVAELIPLAEELVARGWLIEKETQDVVALDEADHKAEK